MKAIPLTQSRFAIVDDDDFEMLSRFNWHLSPYGYAVRHITRRAGKSSVNMARTIMLPDPDQQVDHRNRSRLDNRRCNLRVCTSEENTHNSSKPCTNRSGFKGVSWHRKGQKWQAHIRANRRNMYLGLFSDVEDAALAYDAAAREHHGEFACVNFAEVTP